MGLDTASSIGGLDKNSPLSVDPRSEGDDHIRKIKEVLVADLANVTGAVTSTHTELNYVDIATLGTAEDSKAVTIDAASAFTLAGMTCTDAGILTTVEITSADLNGGTIDGVALGTTNTGNTESLGDDSTKLATTEFVHQEFTGIIVTSAAHTTYIAGEDWTAAHGKASVPDFVCGFAILQATHTDGGYAAGDKIALNYVASLGGIQFWADATNLGAVVTNGQAPIGRNKTTGASFTLATGEWDIHIQGHWYS
jgi:hypothetical protein